MKITFPSTSSYPTLQLTVKPSVHASFSSYNPNKPHSGTEQPHHRSATIERSLLHAYKRMGATVLAIQLVSDQLHLTDTVRPDYACQSSSVKSATTAIAALLPEAAA